MSVSTTSPGGLAEAPAATLPDARAHEGPASRHAARACVALDALNDATLGEPALDPAEVAAILRHLSCAAAALPQALAQLTQILENLPPEQPVAHGSHRRRASGPDPVLLEQAREAAVDLAAHLEAALTDPGR